jgi:benzodiazapine receptor
MNPDRRRQLVNLAAFLVTVVVNGLAVALPLNGQSTAEISDRLATLVTPANYVFSIWSVIYTLLLVFSVYQALPTRATDPALRRIGYLPSVAGVLNTTWIFLWHFNVFALTVPVMLGLLATLIVIYVRLEIGRRPATSLAETIGVRVPWSVYLGWITIATIANIANVLVWLEWDGFGIAAASWAVVVLVAGVGIAAANALTRRDIAYGLVIVWAYVGIGVKQADTQLVAVTAAGGAVVVVALVLFSVVALGRRRGMAPAS